MSQKGTHEGEDRFYKLLVLEDNKITFLNQSVKTGSQKETVPTDIGFLVNDFLINNFKDIVDYGFTAVLNRILIGLQLEVPNGSRS